MTKSQFARAAEALLLALWTLVVSVGETRADSIFFDDTVVHGRVGTMDAKAIGFFRGCGNSEENVDWSTVKEVVFNENCGSPSVKLPSAGGGVCASRPVMRFVIYFRGQDSPVQADVIALTDGTLHYDDGMKLKQGHGPASLLRGIARRSVCPDDQASLDTPPDYCVEDKQFAVNFSYETPLANKILTRGVSFFLETVPARPNRHEELGKLIRDGFGTALTVWMSELQARKERHDPILATFLDGLVSKSPNGYSLVTPPQVIALRCPHVATFIVRVHFDRTGPFATRLQGVKAAYSAKPGRTLVLNFADYPCWQHAYFKFVIEKESRCLNVVAIFLHELGHAFGLGHVGSADSIMNETVYVTKPTEQDLQLLAGQLVRSIQGERPGVIEFIDAVSVE